MTRRSGGWFLLASMLAAIVAGSSVPSCTDDCVTKTGNPSGSCDDLPGDLAGVPGGGSGGHLPSVLLPLKVVAEQCGIDVDCKAGGVLEGNASISGVASVDAYFGSVVRFRGAADQLSAAINAELVAIRGGFGIAANADLESELKARIAAHTDGGLRVRAEPASCKTLASAAVAAKARCEATAMPAKVEVECKGRCEVSVDSPQCSADAELVCAFTAAASACAGECKGRCTSELTAAAACDGVCRGTCTGSCSLYADAAATQCAGRCEGMCSGSCEQPLAVGARCDGACSGECAVASPESGCAGALSASCRAPANAMVTCTGRCEGEAVPPMVKAECEASTKAEAKLSVQCSPPRVTLEYQLKAGVDVDADARLRFELGLQALQQRLPALLALLGRAELTVDAGKGLSAGVEGALEGAVDRIGAVAAVGDLKAAFGLYCAGGEAATVPGVIKTSADKLTASLKGAAAITGAIGL